MSAGGGATARLSVAVDPPEQACVERRAGPGRGGAGPNRARGRPELRALGPAASHYPLLRWQPPGGGDGRVVGVPCRDDREVGELSVGAPLLPAPRRPRNLTVEIDATTGARAGCRELAGALREGDRMGARAQALLWPTCRWAGAGGEPLSLPPRGDPAPATPALRFRPRSLTLYRSWLEPVGARDEGARRAAPRTPLLSGPGGAWLRHARARRSPGNRSWPRPRTVVQNRPPGTSRSPQCADSERERAPAPKRMRPANHPSETGRQGCSCKGFLRTCAARGPSVVQPPRPPPSSPVRWHPRPPAT